MTTASFRQVLFLCASSAALLGGASSASAQSAPPASDRQAATSAPATLTEVIVTAERKQNNIQKVPVAVSVFTGAERDKLGIESVQDVSNYAPGFIYNASTLNGAIRGIQRQSVNVTNDSRVAAYEDGFWVYSPYNLSLSSLFLSQEQIERGPQNVGGRNAAAGSIDMISVRPTDEPYAEVRARIASFDRMVFEGAVSGPVAPGLDLRLAASKTDQGEGYYKNLATGLSEGDRVNEYHVEGQLDWKPNDKADLWVRAFTSKWQTDEGDAGARAGYSTGSWDETNLTDGNAYIGGSFFVNPNYGYAALPGAARTAAMTANPATGIPVLGSVVLANPNISDNPSLTDPNTFASTVPRSVSVSNFNDLNYVFNYNLPGATFRYIGGVQGFDDNIRYGVDTGVESFTLPGSSGTPAALLAARGLPAASQLEIYPQAITTFTEHNVWTSHEFVLQSDNESPFQWTAGAIYFAERYSNPRILSAPQQANFSSPDSLTALVVNGAGATNPFLPGALTPAAPNPQRDLIYYNYHITAQSEAAYGEASYKFNDQFKITGNLRFTHDSKDGDEQWRAVTFSSQFINALSPYFGAATPSFDETLQSSCPTGIGSANLALRGSCYSGPLAKGVTSIGVVGANGIETRGLGDSSNTVTGGVGAEWTPRRDIFVYARYSRGYEPFAFNAGNISPEPEVAPEFVNSYEVGYKQSFGRTVSIDLAAFYLDYQKIQIPLYSNINGSIGQLFVNVPRAESAGIEFEGHWIPLPNWVLSASYSYDYTSILTKCHGTISNGLLTPGANAACYADTADPLAVAPGARPYPGQSAAAGAIDQSVNGSPLPNAPRNKLALTSAYTWKLPHGDLTLAGSYSWRDVQDGAIFDRSYNNAPSWSDVDFRVEWRPQGGRYEVLAYVKNAFNTLQYAAANTGQGLYGSTIGVTTAAQGLYKVANYTLAPPRTFGLELRYKFF